MSRHDILALQSQVRSLSMRLDQLELDFKSLAPTHTPPPAPPTTPPPAPLSPPAIAPPSAPAITDALLARKSSVRAGISTRPDLHAPFNTDTSSPPPTHTAPPAHAHKQVNLEWLVGGRIYAVLGALVVIAGVGLFLKLAWDRGWFAVLPNTWKCILSASFGAVLLAIGELLRKKWGALASIGCSAAGLGIIYAAAYAAYGAFHLVSHQLGFAMLAATAALGIFIGARARLVSIAIVSMLGAYLAPFFFLDVRPTPIVLPAYLSAILIMALTLCAHLGGRFTATRTLAWWATVLLGSAWTLANAAEHPLIACAFLCLSWGAIQGELIISAIRASATPHHIPPDAPVTRIHWKRTRPFAVSFSTSAWAAFLGGFTMHWWHDAPWMATASGFAATAILGSWLAGHVRVLRDTPESDRERLGAAFIIQAGVFLIMTTALALAGWLEVAAWISMGVAAIITGRWLRARPLDIYGIVTLTLASLRLILFDKAATPALAIGTDVAGMFLTRWSAMMALCALAWIATGELIRRAAPPKSNWFATAITMQLVGTLTLAIAPFDPQTSPISVAWMWAALAGIAFTLGTITKRAEWRWFAVCAMLPALFLAFAGYRMWTWTDITAAPLAHGAWWFLILCAVAWFVMGRWITRRGVTQEIQSAGLGIASLGGLTLFVTSTLEVARVVPQITDTLTAQRAAVSIWWGLCAVALLAVGFARRQAALRHGGLTLLGIATAKAVLFDLIGVSSAWRIASFLLLGVLMIGVAAVYTRLNSVFNTSDAPDDHSTDDTGVTTPASDTDAISGA